MKAEKQLYIEELIDRFFVGETSNQEEQILYQYFSEEEIPENLLRYKSFFSFLACDFNKRLIDKNSLKETFPPCKQPVRKKGWIAVAAVALLCITIGINRFLDTSGVHCRSENFVVINGIKITDPEIIQTQGELLLLQHLYEEVIIEQLLLESAFIPEDGEWEQIEIIIQE